PLPISLHLQRGEGGALVLDLPRGARRGLSSAAGGRTAFGVLDAGGRRIDGEPIGSRTAAARPPANGERLYDATLDGEPARVVELALRADPGAGRPGATVRVAETKEQRVALAREFLLSVVLPQLLLVLIAGVVVWHGVVRGLAPLERLRRALG